jgi:hypothetical protein
VDERKNLPEHETLTWRSCATTSELKSKFTEKKLLYRAALAAIDSNADGVVDKKDAGFDTLRVWIDDNSNGVTDAGELQTLSDAAVASINLSHDGSVTYQNGNALQGLSSFTTTSGEKNDVVDAWFQMSGPGILSLKNGMNLDLSGLSNAAQVSGIDMAADSAANTVTLALADVLCTAATNGVHRLTLTGDTNDKVDLDIANWTNTGTTVTENDHSYAVYNATHFTAAQLLIDQHMLMTQVI